MDADIEKHGIVTVVAFTMKVGTMGDISKAWVGQGVAPLEVFPHLSANGETILRCWSSFEMLMWNVRVAESTDQIGYWDEGEACEVVYVEWPTEQEV